jgi:DNA-binding transcriptional regulator YdaS (Cro superfamily)
MHSLTQAISIVGSQRALAERCGVVQTAVAAWLKRGRVPSEYCALIEQATNAKVTRQQLRPLDWQLIWPELLVSKSTQIEGRKT